MITITVENNQSIWDIALQRYGSTNSVKQLILDNPDKVNFKNNIAPGTKLLINEDLIIDKQLVDTYKKNGTIPCSAHYDAALGYGNGDFNNDFSNDFNN